MRRPIWILRPLQTTGQKHLSLISDASVLVDNSQSTPHEVLKMGEEFSIWLAESRN
jgi:hypothetical protein